MLLDRERSALLVVDVQSRLAPAMAGAEAVVGRVRVLLEAARRLGVPTLVSEQYPKGLGGTVDELAPSLGDAKVIAKNAFSCAREPGLASALRAMGRPQVVICGMETHV
ncbi:MAG TPA: isochorismatase family protein, partial [Geminicoccaceae bacterium]